MIKMALLIGVVVASDIDVLKPEEQGYICGVQGVLDYLVRTHPELTKPTVRFDCSALYQRLKDAGVPVFGGAQ